VSVDVLDLVDPDRFARGGYPHDVWTHLRAHDPVARIEAPGYEPFWAVTKHADVVAVSARAVEYSNAQGITLARAGAPVLPPVDLLVLMDPPRHGPMRKLVLPWFTPKAVRARRDELTGIARGIVDDAVPLGTPGELDAVGDIAAPFPLALVAWILGVPETDWNRLFRLSKEVIGKDDPEFRRAGESPGQTARRARGEIHACFADLVAQRRQDPEDDLVSALVGSTIDGRPLTDQQLLLYCELLVEAGNETTRNAISGGLLAFCEHPEAWDSLRARPELLPTAVDEILRWVSPISHFTRIATEDQELHGRVIRTGDRLALYYASANRDEDVFDDPFTFRIDRSPNPHLTFGFGEHFCVGAHLARVEVELVLAHLIGRVERFELAGPVERLRSIVNGSIKRLPLRYANG
jgi:cytochrome P450